MKVEFLKDCEEGKKKEVKEFHHKIAERLVHEKKASFFNLNVTKKKGKEWRDKKKKEDPDNKWTKGLDKLHPDDKLIEILQKDNLLYLIRKELDKKIVKEYETKNTVFLIVMGGSLVTNIEPSSINLMVNDESGAGKDYVMSKIMEFLPKEKVIIRKRISETTFTYWHNIKFEPEWTWDGKILYLEDLGNNILNSEVFKVFSTNQLGQVNYSTIIKNQFPLEIGIRGKPVIVLTIATANPNHELLRRFPICNLDTTEDQTKLILKRKAELAQKGINPSYDNDIMESLKFLKKVKVKIPFANKLANVLSTKNIIIRTTFDRFLDYIKFSSAIHQYKREEDEDGFLIAKKQDYDVARSAMEKTTSNVFSIPLTKNQRRILDTFIKIKDKKLTIAFSQPLSNYNENKREFPMCSVSDLEPYITFISDKTLRKELDKLTEFGFLVKDKEKRDTSFKPVMIYGFIGNLEVKFPKWEELREIAIETKEVKEVEARVYEI